MNDLTKQNYQVLYVSQKIKSLYELLVRFQVLTQWKESSRSYQTRVPVNPFLKRPSVAKALFGDALCPYSLGASNYQKTSACRRPLIFGPRFS